MSHPGERPSPARVNDFLVPVAAALGSFVLVIGFFAPRLMLWQWIDLPSSPSHYAEVGRAIDTLRQLDDPFVRIKNPTHQVINWRLLFPVLGHYLHLPPRVFLALPHLGCLLVLGYVAHLVYRETNDRRDAFLVSALVATASWFFISTGWLAYFDSWYILGLFVVSFSRSIAATVLACLLTPWVDERFVLTMPLALVVRGVNLGWIEAGQRGRFVSEGMRWLALVAPYCAIRLVALVAAQDEGSASHLRTYANFERLAHDPATLLDGLWSGLRSLWVFVAASAGMLFRKGRPAWGVLVGLTLVATTVANLLVVNDLSRTISLLVPSAFLGMVLLLRARPVAARRLLMVVLVFNLLTPARHVVLGWPHPERIAPFHIELGLYLHPPSYLADQYRSRGMSLIIKGQLPQALEAFDAAVRLSPDSPDARVGRGYCLMAMGRNREAAECFDAAIRLAPDRPDMYLSRSRFRRSSGQAAGAVEDLRKALQLSPANARNRPEIERALAEALQPMRTP